MAAKNTLTSADAQLVEAAFQAKLASFGEGRIAEAGADQGRPEKGGGEERKKEGAPSAGEPEHAPWLEENAWQSVRETAPAVRPPVAAKTIRLRDKGHREFVARQPCLLCGRTPADPHHLRFAQPRALGRKVSDEFTVPLCRVHHDELHRHGDEAAYWNALKIDPAPIALALWRLSRPNGACGPKRAGVRPQAANSEDVAKLSDE